MSDYTELVKALRYCAESGDFNCNKDCPMYPNYPKCLTKMDTDAAAAIEALNRLLDQNTQRCEALRKQLREAHESYERHLNELEAQLPKRGEWIYEDLDNFRKYKVTCPHCGKWFVGNYDAYDEPSDFLYCPHCGNICNPTNLDWENELKEREKESRAKMEVQDGKRCD